MTSSSEKLVTVVTGAGSGVGAATALTLASKGYIVVGLAIKFDKDISANDENIYTKVCDVTVEEQVIEAFEWVKEKFGGVDVLVNNAGVCKVGGVTHGKYGDWKAMIDVNVLAVSLCTKEALKTMRQRGDNGVIINISSITGKYVPRDHDLGMYAASKHALTALSQAISNELMREKSKIRVTNISPGTIFTELMLKVAAELHGKTHDPKVLQGPLPEGVLDPQDIADSILYILEAPSRVQIPELTIQPVCQKQT